MESQNLYTSSFKKFGLYLLLLLLSFFAFGYVFDVLFHSEIINKSEISGASKVNRILNEEDQNEIPIFGSSRARGSYVPSELGANYFNYGIPGIQSDVWLFFLQEELKKKRITPIIVNLDAYGLTYKIGDLNNYIPNINRTEKIIGDKTKSYYRFPFVRFFGNYEHYFKDYINEQINLTKKTNNGGSFDIQKFTKSKFDDLVEQRLVNGDSCKIDKKLQARLTSLLGSTNREICFVVAPYHSSYWVNFKGMNNFVKLIKSIDSFENVTVLNYMDLKMTDSQFMNTSHLNYEGALEFSRLLKSDFDKLKKN